MGDVEARERRAEEFRKQMNRLTEEAEKECGRLEFEGAARRRRFDAESAAWTGRVNSVADELRKNFANWSPFEHPTSGSMPHPRPQPPSFPRDSRRPMPPPNARRRIVGRSL